MNRYLRSLVIGGWFVVVRLASRGTGSYVIGSTMAHFSLGAGIAPLAGLYGGVVGAMSAGLISLLLHSLVTGSYSLASCALIVPGVVGGFFFATRSRMAKGMVILSCMVLFWLHPIGQQAFLYPLLWFVPLIVVASGMEHMFARALAGTFVVHAVGACLWLYLVPMSPLLWHSMMPLVVVERVVNALSMTAVVFGVEKISVLVRSYYSVRASYSRA